MLEKVFSVQRRDEIAGCCCKGRFVGPEPTRAESISGSLHQKPCGICSICNTDNPGTLFSAHVSLGPDFTRRGCISGDKLGSEIGVLAFRSCLWHLVAA